MNRYESKKSKKDDDDEDDEGKDESRRRRRTGRRRVSEQRAYSTTFNRRLHEGGDVVGAVRVWFNESQQPVGYEYYNRKGVLESVRDRRGRVVHRTAGHQLKHNAGLWEDQQGKYCRPAVFEEETLSARHGGTTLVKTKGDGHKGKAGPEYSMSTMNKPGDRGQDGSAQTPGDYDDASEEGDGEHVEKGTWPESFDADLHADNAALREQVAFLEGELSRYEDIVQEQHETIREADERARLMQVDEARARVVAQHPELSAVSGRLGMCESVEELTREVNSMLSLIETVKPASAPAPLLVETAVRGTTSTSLRDGVPSGMLTESSYPSLGGPSRTNIGTGDVASRVAASRKRRQSR
jgi:hypothetical protein